MSLWFWGWLVVTVAIAVVSVATRDRTSAPFAAGAAMAVIIEAFHGSPAWEWIAFVVVTSAVFVALNRLSAYRPRHGSGGAGRHSATRRTAQS